MFYYRLIDLVEFFEKCAEDEFNPIRDVIGFANDMNLSEEDRLKFVIAVMEFHGLNPEVLEKSKNVEMKLEDPIFKGRFCVTQLFDVHFTNGVKWFNQNLN